MKLEFKYFSAALALTVSLITAGCNHDPNPPTEAEAIAVWKNLHARPHMQDLISLKKTNGQLQTINGAKVYTLYYEAKSKFVVQEGPATLPGTINNNQSNYPFEWTEKGWLGPDGQVYPAR